MRRFVFFAVICALSLPVGLSITGCSNNYGQNFCSGFQSGPSSTAVATITLQPSTYGISLNYGQVYSVEGPQASNCKGQPVKVSNFTYGITKPIPGNTYLADVSPTGQVCGGTWNRNSGNGVADFTTCIPTGPGGVVYNAGGGVAYVTASANGATSNPVPVYVHPPVTSVVLNGNGTSAPGCVSQNDTSALTAEVYSGSQDITNVAGHLTYTPQNQSIVTIDQTGVATALQPGATVVSANVSQATSTAGYFFTCPPASIKLNVGTTDQTSVTVNTNNTQPLTATVLDTHNNPITGLALTYSSNDPINIPVSNAGAVTPAYPSDAAITAQCLPNICNPAPQDQIGNLSVGLPVSSNPVDIYTPGPSSNILYMASPQSYNFVALDFQTGTVGAPIRLPYQPNSMVMDEKGNYLFFGSAQENMIVSISALSGPSLINVTAGVPGTVLAVAPDDSLVVIHDPCRKLFYLYSPAIGNTKTAAQLSFAAPGPTVACNANNQPLDPSVEVNPPYSATFTQDSQTVYIVGDNSLYVYSTFTGWHTCTDNGQAGNCPVGPTGLAVTVPGVGAFAGGSTTTAFGYCATGPNNAGQNAGPPPTGIDPNTALNPTAYYPLAATVGAATDELAATTDGFHIIGASALGELTDIEPTIPTGMCPLKSGLTFPNSFTQNALTVPGGTSINQVLVSPNSQLGFVTFFPTSATPGAGTGLPAYQIPCTTAQQQSSTGCPAGQVPPGGQSLKNIPLAGSADIPIAGVFSPDTNTFYVSTTGDDMVHFINTTTLTDTQQINPDLTCGATVTGASEPFLECTQSAPVPALFLASRPRPSQGVNTTARKN